MEAKVRITSVLGAEPVSAHYLREHLRLSQDMASPEYLDGLIAAAREWVEDRTWLTLREVEAEVTLDEFPRNAKAIDIPLSPLNSVTSLQYRDTDGDLVTLDPEDYEVDTVSIPPRVVPVDGWPSTGTGVNVVRLTVRAGYTDAPQKLKQAMLLLGGHWFEHREEVVVGTSVIPVPLAAMDLCDSVNRRAAS